MAFATYRDIVSGSSGSSKSSKISTYQDIKKSITPTQFEENRKKLQETNDRNLQIERQKKQEEVLKKSQAETEKYLQDFNDASTGFGGSILKRFGIGATAPTLAQSPVTQSPAYQQSQQIGTENTSNLGKTVGANIKEAAKSLFTENTTNSVYDIAHQSGVDKQNLDVIENNTKKIVELHNKKKISTDQAESKKLDTAIGFLLEQNRQVAEQVGGEIKDKSNLQLLGQSVGTAMELLPIGVGSGMTQAGKLILEAGTKQALKALGKEAALYGATVASSGKAQEKGATAGDVATSGVIGGLTGLATIAIPGLAKWATKDGGKYIQNLFKKISTDGTQSLSKEEAAALKEIVTSKEEVPNNTSVTEQTKTEVKPTQVDPLLQEARKYKSAEEFVKAKSTVWRGGSGYHPAKINPSDGVSFSYDKKIGERFSEMARASGGSGPLQSFYVEPWAKILQQKDIPKNLLNSEYDMVAYAKKNGYDAIHFDSLGQYKESELRVVNPKVIKGKWELTDIWKKAQEKPIDTSLPEQLKPDVTPKKESGYAKSLETKAVEKKMASEFQDLAEYTPAVRKEQAQMTTKLINEDIEKVNSILDGKAELPSGMRGSSLALAVEQHAIANNDVKLLQKLAKSKIATGISEAGSELSMLAGRNANSPVRIIRNIIKARKDNVVKRLKGKKISEARKATKESIKKAIKKEAPTKETWTNFIKEIKC